MYTDTFVSIDPGLRHCGVALWEDKMLQESCLIVGSKPDDRLDNIEACYKMAKAVSIYKGVHTLIVEFPQAYRPKFQKGDPNDLLWLAAVVGAIATEYIPESNVITYLPREHKGQTPKEVIEQRVQKKLSPEELKNIVLPARSLQHNVYDAIGIGLFYLQR